MTLTLPTNCAENEIMGQGLIKMADLVNEATDGAVTIEIYFSGSLFTQDQILPAVMAGNADMCGTNGSGLSEYLPKTATIEAPYLFSSVDEFIAFFDSDVANDLIEEVADTVGVQFLAVYATGLRCVNINVDRKITCRADLEDIKIRMPNTPNYLFLGEALGANPIPLAGSDIYLGLEAGTVDGQDNPVAAIRAYSWYEVTESVTLTNHMMQNSWITIRNDLWQGMSPELQQIFKEAATEACEWITATNKVQQEDDIAFLEEQGMSIYELTDEEFENYRQEVLDYYEEHPEGTADWDMDLYNAIKDLNS